jgi:hypothetical protein
MNVFADSIVAYVNTGNIDHRKISFLVQANNGNSKTKLDESVAVIVSDKKGPSVSSVASGCVNGTNCTNNTATNGTLSNAVLVSDTNYRLSFTGTNVFLDSISARPVRNVGCFTFNEPMDTTATLTGAFINKEYATDKGLDTIKAKAVIKHRWVANGANSCSENLSAAPTPSATVLCLCMSTKEFADAIAANDINIRYRISGLKDRQQNSLEQKIENVPIYTEGVLTSYKTKIWDGYIDTRFIR